jgi:hypothetical protein
MAAQGIGMVGVRGCSRMIHVGPLTGKISLALKAEMKISQALCSAIDTRYQTAVIGDRMESWVLATVFASYYNTLRYALEIGASKVVLTLMGGGVFGVQGNLIFLCAVFAMKMVAIERPQIKDVKVYFALWDYSETTTSGFYNAANAKTDPKFEVNSVHVDSVDDIPV